MSGQWNDERRDLLRALQNIGGAGRAEGEPPERIASGFHPVPEHLRLLDPEVVLVVGPRGSGKTEIARVLTDATLYEAVSRHAPAVRLPAGRSSWLRAFPMDAEGFEKIGLRSFVGTHGGAGEELQALWFAYLVRVLFGRLESEDRSALDSLRQLPGGDVEAIVRTFHDLGTRPVLALDRMDARLREREHFVFVTYDELDTLGGGEWSLIEAGVRGLVAFWAAYARRWRRLRAKLFLRTDLYERHARSGGADLAKLAAGRVELTWSDRDLYGLLLKRLANVEERLARYVQEVRTVDWSTDPDLGRIPRLQRWQDARPVVERMVGMYMGANQKKGLVYRWLLDHVRDGLGRAFPRPFVQLVEEGARQELRYFGTLSRPRLLQPSSLRRSLDRVSADHVADSRHEWPWLDRVRERFSTNHLVPWQRDREVIELLEGLRGGGSSSDVPFEGREMLEYLLEVGVLRRRADGRIDAPDLFLAGLGLGRKGGVKKRG